MPVAFQGGFFCWGDCFVKFRGGMVTHRYPDCTVFFVCMGVVWCVQSGSMYSFDVRLHIAVLKDLFMSAV